ncbi:MAG: hypothetical protein ABIE07_00595 [Candidatus Zixiibacteriota bacterium]
MVLFRIKKDKLIKKFIFELVEFAVNTTNSIFQIENKTKDDAPRIGDEIWFRIIFEYIFINVHLLDRFLSVYIKDTSKRFEIMDGIIYKAILLTVNTICKDWPEQTKSKIVDECLENYNNAVAEYSGYAELINKDDDSPKGTLFWEFGKNISSIYGKELDIAYIMFAQSAETDFMISHDIKSLAKNLV